MCPLSLLLVSKSIHANLLILASEESMEQSSLILDTFPDTQVLTLVNRLFASLDRNLGVSSNLCCRVQRTFDTSLGSIKALGHQTPLLSFLAREVVTSKNNLHSFCLAHRAGESLRSSRTRNDPQLNLGLAKSSALGRVQDIAHHCQLTTTAQCIPIHSTDNRFLDVSEVGPGFDEVGAVGVGKGLWGHFFDVGAGGEGFRGTGQDNGGDGGVFVESGCAGVEFVDQRGEEGVEGFGSVEGDYRRTVMSAACKTQRKARRFRTQGDTGSGSAELNVLIVVLG